MSSVISTILDPIGFGFGEAITGKDSAIVNVSDLYGMKGERGEGEKVDKTGETYTPSKGEGVITDAEAADLARKRLFRSGTVYTSTLGEEIDPNSLAGSRLQ